MVPIKISEYLTPLSLGIWIMDSACRVLSLNYIQIVFLKTILFVKAFTDNFGLKAFISTGSNKLYYIYIWNKYMLDLIDLVSQYVLPNMKYKNIEDNTYKSKKK